MPWLPESHLAWLRTRIDTLETLLATERAENRRREDWQCAMLNRRGGTFPVPEKDAPTDTVDEAVSRFSSEDIGKAIALRDEGYRLQAEHICRHDPEHVNRECVQPSDSEIEQAVKLATGMTLYDVRQAETLEAEMIS